METEAGAHNGLAWDWSIPEQGGPGVGVGRQDSVSPECSRAPAREKGSVQ